MRPHDLPNNTKSLEENPKISGQLNSLNCFRSETLSWFLTTKNLHFFFVKAGARSTIASVLDHCLWILWRRHSSREVGRWVLWCFGASVWARFASASSRSPELFPVAMVKLQNQQSFLQQTLDSALVGTGWGKSRCSMQEFGATSKRLGKSFSARFGGLGPKRRGDIWTSSNYIQTPGNQKTSKCFACWFQTSELNLFLLRAIVPRFSMFSPCFHL